MILNDIDNLILYIQEINTENAVKIAKAIGTIGAASVVGLGIGTPLMNLKYGYDVELLNAHRDVDTLKKTISAGLVGAGVGSLAPAAYRLMYKHNNKPDTRLSLKAPIIAPTNPISNAIT